MLTRSGLLALERSLRSERVLSVYVNGEETDVAARGKWRLDLAHAVKGLRTWLEGSPHDERRELEACLALIDRELHAFTRSIGAPGWVAFVTAGGIQRAERVPVPVPTLAVWSTGPSIAPYMRILKAARPIILVVADARRGRLFRYRLGKLTRVGSVRARATVEPPGHMGDAPSGGFHPGVRGPSGHDAAQRSLLAGTRRMVGELADEAARLVGPDGWIVVGGIPEVAEQILTALHRFAPGRIGLLDSLDVHASPAQIAAAARDGASALRDEVALERIAEIVDRAGGEGLAALGPAATGAALAEKRVHALYVTRLYQERHAAEAETAVRAALTQGATVEEVERAAAARLDEHGGMGARLRYRVATPPQ